MEQGHWRQFSHGLILLVGVLLLVVTRGVLIDNPLLGSAILLLFSLLSIAFAYLLAPVFMYPFAFLLTFSYFLFVYRMVPSFPLVAPMLSVPFVVLLSGVSWALKRAKVPGPGFGPENSLKLLDNTACLVSFFFVGALLVQSRTYLSKQPIIAGCTFAFYSIFYFWQLIRLPKKSSHWPTAWLYLALLCLALSLFFLLCPICAMSVESHGLYLTILFMVFMYLGVVRQMQTGENQWHPALVIGSGGLLISLWYCYLNLSLLMVVLFLYSFHFYRLHTIQNKLRSQESGVRSQESEVRIQESGVRIQNPGVRSQESEVRIQESGVSMEVAAPSAPIKEAEGRSQGPLTRDQQPKQDKFLKLSYIPTLVYLLLFAWNGFPVNFFCLGIALAYALLYFTEAWQNCPEDKRGRSIPAYLFGLFMNIAFFECLLIHSPVYEISWYLILAIPLIWLLFWLGYLGQQQGMTAFSKSIYEIQFLTVLFSFLIPLQLSNYSLDFICMLAVGYLFSMLLFFLITEDKKFIFPTVLVLAFLYYYLIPKGNIHYGGASLLFLLPAFLLLCLGMWSQRKGYSLTEAWYLGWMTLSGFFLVTLQYNSSFCIYGLSVCALLHCLAYGYLAGAFPRLSRVSYWIANILSLLAVAVWIYTKSLFPSGIFLGLILSASHLFMAYQTKRVIHAYVACFALAAVWYGEFLAGVPCAMLLPVAFPVALLLYGCSFWAKPFLPWGKNVFKSTGHIWVALVTLTALIGSGAGSGAGNVAGNATWLFLPLLVYALGYLVLSWYSPCYEYFFLTTTFFSISYYFSLQRLAGVSASMRLQYFFICPFFLGFAGYIVKRRQGEGRAQSIFDVATLVGLACSIMALFNGNLEVSQKILLLSAILYMFLAVQLVKELYLYLTTITLGLLAYNFLNIDNLRFVGDLSVYSLYLIIFLCLFFFLAPAANRSEASGLSGHGTALLLWKKAIACLVLLAGFPCILIPLYSQKIINYPGFCSQCHYMRPYAEAWQTSSHQTVSCIACHYEPLTIPVGGESNGRLGLALKSLARTYSIFPQAKVSDQACLQQGCHKWEDIRKEKQFKQDIRFSHSQHLQKNPRGKRLGCITCHSQIVQGKHVLVTEATCFDCHFKGRQEKDTGVGGCVTCHSLPGISISFAGVNFTHQGFMSQNENLQCTDCHLKVTQGEGMVPRERCYTCHLTAKRQADDPALIHSVHVNRHMIECFHCHQDIQHGQKGISKQASINCMACHRNGHSLPKKGYTCQKEKGSHEMTESMFSDKKACRECHS